MLRKRLLLLYPRSWRVRYGDEFLALMEAHPMRASQLIDILRGALDARLSPEVRRTTCVALRGRRPGVTPRDGLIGAGLMLALTFAMQTLSHAALGNGFPEIGSALKELAFPIPFTVSMPFWLMKGTSWRAQTAIVGVTVCLLIASSILSHAR
jgi:hypothetical protein